jgi:hypothetical protein
VALKSSPFYTSVGEKIKWVYLHIISILLAKIIITITNRFQEYGLYRVVSE